MRPHTRLATGRRAVAGTALGTLALGATAALASAPAALAAAQSSSLVSPSGEVDWNRFYTAAETNQILREFHALYPGLTELHQIGSSLLGQPLMTITITNEATGPASEKPALYVDGGIHAGELTGSGGRDSPDRPPAQRLRQRPARDRPARRARLLRLAQVQPRRLGPRADPR